MALTAVLLASDLGKPRNAIAAAVLFVLAVGFHATNATLGLFVLAVFWRRTRGVGWAPFVWFAASGLVVGLVVLGVLEGYRTGTLWPLQLDAYFPQMLPEAPMSIPARLGRVAFGATRSIAFVPYFREIRAGYLLCAGLLGFAAVVVVALGLKGGSGRSRGSLGIGSVASRSWCSRSRVLASSTFRPTRSDGSF